MLAKTGQWKHGYYCTVTFIHEFCMHLQLNELKIATALQQRFSGPRPWIKILCSSLFGLPLLVVVWSFYGAKRSCNYIQFCKTITIFIPSWWLEGSLGTRLKVSISCLPSPLGVSSAQWVWWTLSCGRSETPCSAAVHPRWWGDRGEPSRETKCVCGRQAGCLRAHGSVSVSLSL